MTISYTGNSQLINKRVHIELMRCIRIVPLRGEKFQVTLTKQSLVPLSSQLPLVSRSAESSRAFYHNKIAHVYKT